MNELRRLRGALANAALLVAVCAFCAIAVEAGYRWYLQYSLVPAGSDAPPAAEASFVFYTKPEPWRFARAGGFEYNEGRWSNGVIEKGAFLRCRFFGEGNRYGGYGSIKQQWESADLRILMLGSSYTLMGENDNNPAEHMRQALKQKLNRPVAVINLSRDSTGILTMFDIAAEKIAELRPDIILFTFNTSAFGYDRHWRTVRPLTAYAEILYLLKDPDPSTPRRRALPQPAIVSKEVTPEWCAAMIAAKERGEERRLREDPVVRHLVEAYEQYRTKHAPAPVALDFLRLDTSFVLNMVRHKDPFFGMKVQQEIAIFTPITMTDFREDPMFVAALDKVKTSKLPFFLIHVPALPEMQTGAPYAHGRFGVREEIERPLSANLEVVTGQTVHHLWDRYSAADRAAPSELVYGENNWHPNERGSRAAGLAMAQIISEYLAATPMRARKQ